MSNKTKFIIGVMGAAIAGLFIWGFYTTTQLNSTRSELTMTQQALSDTEGKLAATASELEDTITRLESTEQELTATQNHLAVTQNQLTAKTNELNSTKVELDSTRTELSSTKSELSSTAGQLASSQQTVTNLQATLSQTQQKLTVAQSTLSGLGITLYNSAECTDAQLVDNPGATDPTYVQLLNFLAQDTTENHPYIINAYDCSQFSRDLHNWAEAAGIRCAEVQVWFTNSWSGHALNAFLTTDYGLVYVDCTEAPDRFARVKAYKVYRSLDVQSVPASVLRTDTWWDTLNSYYYIASDFGSQAIVDEILIYW